MNSSRERTTVTFSLSEFSAMTNWLRPNDASMNSEAIVGLINEIVNVDVDAYFRCRKPYSTVRYFSPDN